MSNSKKIIAIIPARGGSVRLKRKNILPIASCPLLAHSILQAIKEPRISEVIVSTEMGSELCFLHHPANKLEIFRRINLESGPVVHRIKRNFSPKAVVGFS